jgi:PAS domain S-box-containing protein
MTTRVLVALWTLALVLAAGATVLIFRSNHDDSPWATFALMLPISLAFVAAGLTAWSRRPENRTGLLMTVVGFTWFVGVLAESNHPLVFTLGIAFGGVAYGFFAWLVLAFPSGRLETVLDRILVAVTFLLATLGWTTFMLFADLRDEIGQDIPEHEFLITRNETAARAIQLVVNSVIFALTTAIIAVLAVRWLRAPQRLRRALTPVYLVSAAVAFLFAISVPLEGLIEGSEAVLRVPIQVGFIAFPLAFLIGLLRGRLARASAVRLLLDVPDNPTPAQAEEGLRRTLADPTLRLVLWLSESGSYVDVTGRPVELPPDTETTVTTLIGYEDRPVAALIHDAVLLNEPDLLEEVVATVRVAAERDQSLHALRVSEQRTRALLDAIPDLMFRISRDGTYLDYKTENEGDLLSPEVIGRSVWDRLPPELAAQVMGAAERALSGGGLQTIEYALEIEGEQRQYEGRVVASGADEFLLIVREITKQRRLQDELSARVEELRVERDIVRTVVDTAPTLFCGVDRDGKIIRFNRALRRLSGHTEEAMRGRPFWDVFVVPEQAKDVERGFRAAISGSIDREFEHLWRMHDGNEAVVAWSANWYPGERGEVRYLVTGTNITRRKRAEAKLEDMAEEQTALRRVATLVASEAPPESIFQLATAEAAHVAKAESAGMIRFEDDHTGRVVGRWHGSGPTGFEIGSVLPLDPETTLGQVFWTGRPARVESLEEASGPFAESLREMGFHSSVGAPITVAGRLWGALVVATTGSRALPEDTERRLGDFGELVALALASADAREELIVSRARIVEAGDAERRRLERNLHDGAQQRLVVLSLLLRLAKTKLASAPEETERLLAESSDQLAQALDDLRELARGIHPAVLSDRGLEPALKALASRAPIAVEIDAPEERLPQPVEAAAYYVVSEALANATKYARASEVSVRVAHDNGLAVVEVSDDGVGGADPTAGSGLRGLADRVSALDGRLDIASEPGEGTRIVARIPLVREEVAT